MKPKNRRLVLLSILAVTAAFSASSLKANYFTVGHHSTFACQAVVDQDAFSEATVYNEDGINNVSPENFLFVSCPVNMDSEAEGSNYIYNIHLIAGGTKDATAGQIACILAEVRNIDGTKTQVQGRVANLIGKSKKSLIWQNVDRLAFARESAFTVQCNMPPQSSLTNITVRRGTI